MTSPYSIARAHIEAAGQEARSAGIDEERLGKALLREILQQLRQHRSADDIRSEVAFELENLEDDQEFHFMRP